jgi:peptidylprolyl isomerase
MRVRAVLLAIPLFVLAACGSGGDSSGTSATSTSGTSAAATLGPTVPAATAVAEPVPADQMPTVSGAFGEKPTLTFPAGNPPPSLQRVVLSEGTGPVVESGDWLVTNYLGQIWGGEVFDNSYDRGATSTFQIGVRAVVPGWDTGLVGVPVGSRVMLSLPPADGYGSTGNSGAGIGGTDTLVFVVDIANAIGPDAGGQADATPEPAPAGSPEVSGALGSKPTVTIPAGLPEPTEQSLAVLARGTGPAIVANSQVLAQFVAVSWTGEPAGETWPAADGSDATAGGTGPQQLPVQTGTPFEGLVGVPIGSRVLVIIPGQAATTGATPQPAQPAVAAVIDLLAQ